MTDASANGNPSGMHFVEAPNEFYIGGRVDNESGDLIKDAPVYYDARDLDHAWRDFGHDRKR